MTDEEQMNLPIDDELTPEERIDLLEQSMGLAAEQLTEITKYLAASPTGGPWFWEALRDDERTTLLTELTEFVFWLDRTYLQHVQRYQFAKCWHLHPPVVEELTALMVAHRAVYNPTMRKHSSDLSTWHERALWPTLDRIDLFGRMGSCGKQHLGMEVDEQRFIEPLAISDELKRLVGDEAVTGTSWLGIRPTVSEQGVLETE